MKDEAKVQRPKPGCLLTAHEQMIAQIKPLPCLIIMIWRWGKAHFVRNGSLMHQTVTVWGYLYTATFAEVK